MNGGVIFLIVLIFLVLGGYGGWVIWSRMQANRLGLPPPSLIPFARSSSSSGGANYPAPAAGGIKGFFSTQIHKFKNRNNRYATGAYEGASPYESGRGRGAGHRLDPDEAWDARVGNEAHYEEQELGLHEPQGRNYGDTGYGAPSPAFGASEPGRGRSRNREYEDGLHADSASTRNPFGDENAATSLRGVSPRPLDVQDTSYGGAQGHNKNASVDETSPTERRSEDYFKT